MCKIVIRERKEIIFKLFPHIKLFSYIKRSKELAVFKSGAKLHKDPRQDDWIIHGYTPDGSDLIEALKEIIAVKLDRE